MRIVMILMFLLIAGPCNAEDPLETLNTVEDTLSIMAGVLHAQSSGQGDQAGLSQQPRDLADWELYFVSDEVLGGRDWIAVRPCPRHSGPWQAVPAPESCADVTAETGGYFWGSHAAVAADLKPGTVVVSKEELNGTWIMARVTDVSELGTGYVAVSASLKVPVEGLRVVEE